MSKHIPRDERRRPPLRPLIVLVSALVVVALIAFFIGNRGRRTAYHTSGAGSHAAGEHAQDLFDFAVVNLNRLEEYDQPEIIEQITGRLNQWFHTQVPDTGWKPDPLFKRLPASLRPRAMEQSLRELSMHPLDQMFLKQSVWMRNAARTAAGDEIDDLAVAQRLFDWTVRNIQLDPSDDPAQDTVQAPWLTLLLGHGNDLDRARVFILLARQRRLEAVMLAVRQGDAEKPWLPALLNGGKLYLFDTALGLPVPGPGGEGVATLSEAAADESVLHALDLDADHPYRVQKPDVQSAVALIDAEPQLLSLRMRRIEDKLAGDQKIVLAVDASALAAQLVKLKHVEQARLWEPPYLAIVETNKQARDRQLKQMLAFQYQPTLIKARQYQLKGKYVGEEDSPTSAILLYQQCRWSKQKFEQAKEHIEAERFDGLMAAREAATYWLGLIAYERAEYPSAEDYLLQRVLEETPDGFWTAGAHYNLGRVYEAQGLLDKARAAYEQPDPSSQHAGNLIRARRLAAPQGAGAQDSGAQDSGP